MNNFTKEFKERAIKLKEQGIHPNEIFKNEGISIKNKQKDYTIKLLNRWKSDKQIKKKLNSQLTILDVILVKNWNLGTKTLY